MFVVWRIFCDSETNQSVVFTGTLDSKENGFGMPFVFAVLSFLFCLVFTFDIRCPVKMNVNQLHGTVNLAKVIGTPYLLWKLQIYGCSQMSSCTH
jgi:hypothetical protein